VWSRRGSARAVPAGGRPAGLLVRLSGRLDVVHAADVRLALSEQVAAGDGDLVLDLAALAAVDMTGLGVLVGAHRHAGRAGRRLVLCDVPAGVGRMLHVTRLHRVLHQRSSTRAA
jgi:anti-anti-sigma factor